MKNHCEKGMALITALLVLLLMSTMIVGLSWLVAGDQKLGGNNNDRQRAYYGAEAGMEQLTASLENAFDSNYALNLTAINALQTTPGPPTNIPNVQYLLPGNTTNGSGYVIKVTASAANANLPASSSGTIPTGPYAGLVGLMTPYTLEVTAHTTYGSEVKLQREVQTVGIPVFQFGMFSQTDLAYFAGPDFSFGGRVHSNGNLWLADGGTLTLANKVTAVGQVITSNLENGWPTSSGYNGAVDVSTSNSTCLPSMTAPPCDLTNQSPAQSASGTNNYYGHVGTYQSSFGTMVNQVYTTNNLAIGPMNVGVTPLNLAIATPAIGGQTIDMIRRPVYGEDTASPGKLAERYYSQVSLRVLLSDYDTNGKCVNVDINSASSASNALPALSTGVPVDLATLAWDRSAPGGNGNTKIPYRTPPAWLTGVGTTTFPLPTSGAQAGATYNNGEASPNLDGYWITQYYPIITGCIKIDYQSTAGGTWTDVTQKILNLGYTGRDINPQPDNTPASPYEPPFPTTAVGASGPTVATGLSPAPITCTDPSPNAVIRLARVRDNPSWITSSGGCPAPPSLASQTHGTDYWPNVLYDTREALLQDINNPFGTGANASALPVQGAMYYVELDVKNLAACLTSTTICSFSNSVNNTTGYSVYFSDRRGEQADYNPPASVGTTTMLTGGFGFDDNVNFVNNVSAAGGCPNGTLDQGEDVESDYNSAGVSQNSLTTPKTYGNILSTVTAIANPSNPSMLWPIFNTDPTLTTSNVLTGTELGGKSQPAGTAVYNLMNLVLAANPNCTPASPVLFWPLSIAAHPQDLRENPPIFFRRALKIVNGDTISLGTCNSVACGLTIVSENPVYLQGDFNNPGLNTGFTSTADVGASVVADAFTFLSDNWNDVNSFAFPYMSVNDQRKAADTTYRLAVAAGKGIPWENTNGLPSGSATEDFGTDGGAHNFLRYVEDWGGHNLWYEGSIVSMFYNHQAVGTFKCCQNVYSPPTRQYQFDTNFLTPSELPPLTPMLRLVNTIGSTQMILPTD